MKHSRFQLTSEQTLRLEELRDALAETLPAGAAETVAFPVSHYGGCGAVCMPGCTGSCVAGCASSCIVRCIRTCITFVMLLRSCNRIWNTRYLPDNPYRIRIKEVVSSIHINHRSVCKNINIITILTFTVPGVIQITPSMCPEEKR
jgi:hypothetical protein